MKTMPRFNSPQKFPVRTRQCLRDRFLANLPYWQPYIEHPANIEIDDCQALELLLALELREARAVGPFRERYTQLRTLQGELAPTFDELIQRGWIVLSWNEVYWTSELQSLPVEIRDVLTQALQISDVNRYAIVGKINATLERLLDDREDNTVFPRSPSPEWVALRLWENAVRLYDDPPSRLSFWEERWKLLGRPRFHLHNLCKADADSFTFAVLHQIEADPGLLDWAQERHLRCVTLAFESGHQTADEYEKIIPAAPETWLGRDAWLERREFGFIRAIDNARERICGVARVLLMDIAKQHYASAPHDTMLKLVELARTRPVLMETIKLTLRNSPVLFADIVLIPEVAPWAAKIIATIPLHDASIENDLIQRKPSPACTEAFEDSIEIGLHFARRNDTVLRELAELARWLVSRHALNKRQNSSASPAEMGVFLRALSELSLDELATIAEMLVGITPSEYGTPSFMAALELVGAHRLYETASVRPNLPGLLMKLYTSSFHELKEVNDADISEAAAFALARIASAAGGGAWESFLHPYQFTAEARKLVSVADPEQYKRLRILEKSLRAHLRVLARALQGWDGAVPEDLCRVIIDLVRVGAQENLRTGRVAAFRADYEQSAFLPAARPLATDLAFAAARMSIHIQDALMGAAVEFDDALIVAQLLKDAPEAMRDGLAKRLGTLSPDHAPETNTITELHARIDAILNVGHTDLAALYIAQELESATYGPVQRRDVARYLWQVKIDYFSGVRIPSSVPPNISDLDRIEADRVRRFYKALQELRLEDGSPDKAVEQFRALSEECEYNPAYALNWFAALAQRALGKETLLPPASYDRSRVLAALAEGEKIRHRISAMLTPNDHGNYSANRALLLLAADKPRSVLEEFQVLPPEARATAQVAVFSAVALARLGLRDQAMAQIAVARGLHGDHVLTERVSDALSGGAVSLSGTVSVTLTTKDDRVERIRLALRELRVIEPNTQAQAYDTAEPNPSIETLLSRLVRASGTDLVDLAPLIKAATQRPEEDDLTAVFSHMLGARVEPLGWTVKEQSPGGFTATQGAGYRDIILVKESSRSLALFEAITIDRPPSQAFPADDLRMHVGKMFAYERCGLFFLIVYSYVDDCHSLTALVKKVCNDDVPSGWICLGDMKTEVATDNRPPITVATYQSGDRVVRLFQLVLDCQQRLAKQNAIDASRHNPRISKGKKATPS